MPTKIEWVVSPDGSPGETLNPIRFRNRESGFVGHYCEKISKGCQNCYASREQKPYLSQLEYIATNRSRGELFLDEGVLQKVLRRSKPTTWFACSMTDLWGDWVPTEWIEKTFAVMAQAKRHRFIVLTKRPQRMKAILRGACYTAWRESLSRWAEALSPHRPLYPDEIQWPLPNVAIGVSCENQETADERIPCLMETPAALRIVSLEPMLGAVDLSRWMGHCRACNIDHQDEVLNWVIVGGESGPDARPMHPDWARAVRDQCIAKGVPFFFKQWGEWLPEGQAGEGGRTPHLAGHIEIRGVWLDGSSNGLKGDGGYTEAWRVGKRNAGKLLDGVAWQHLPVW